MYLERIITRQIEAAFNRSEACLPYEPPGMVLRTATSPFSSPPSATIRGQRSVLS